MIFCYMDEAGNTGSRIDDPAQPFHYVGGLLVPENDWLAIAESMRKIASDAIGKNAAGQRGFKFRGAEIFAGHGPWQGMHKRERLSVLSSCLSLLGPNSCRIVYGKCNKRRLQQYVYPMHPHSVAFWLCMERAVKFAINSNSLLSLVAATGTRGLSKVAQEFLTEYRANGAPFGRTVDVSGLVDRVQFVPSYESPHLQLCDLWLWVVQRTQTHQPLEECVADLYDLLVGRFSDAGTFPY
jgi:hypothetical protein